MWVEGSIEAFDLTVLTASLPTCSAGTVADRVPVGQWTIRFTDIDPQGVGTVRDVQLTVHTSGFGEPPITTSVVYESAPRDLGGLSSLCEVRWQARQPAWTTVAVKVRTCATATSCAAQPWSAALPGRRWLGPHHAAR